ncbi:basic leucine zipper transcriptional factor ATF-like 3 [Mya arenaria]|uniref:basic leucine zipper transcriptional factor ATF-like 3 n=1 Tax=Mya arenaria TaxID=6604 RepID=UPI0022E3E7C7|nr:basic leucine zipper transcriptional factor ATF-like 3 [Mya arenaria]XP_052819935.1 basic leucine zipper transcriptional factor ATF-like 3 [Mya arenaria]
MEEQQTQVVSSVVPTVVSGLFDNSESDENTDYSTSDNVGHSSTINAIDIRSDESSLTPEEEERVVKRRVQNRMAARRFRDKQKDRAHTLQKECHRQESIQTMLRYELAQVRKERDEFRQALDQHMAVCPLQFPARFYASSSNS